MGILIDDDIAHILRVMQSLLHGFPGGPILPIEYWRRRLHLLLGSGYLTKVQLCAIDNLRLQLDQFETEQPRSGTEHHALYPAAGQRSLFPAARTAEAMQNE